MARLSISMIAFALVALFGAVAGTSMESHHDHRGHGVWGYLNAARAHEQTGHNLAALDGRACERFCNEKEYRDTPLTQIVGGFYNPDVAAMFA